ncbi:MAG: hypothetical protein IKI61_01545 [Erysipelotrichaceae bacterium]|nr:hypothetical protein [Erysipelotrichaceae bacterium]
MSAIAYITDSKMLELHRLNNHKAINFWRPSANTAFSDFSQGDLLFFLSKDKEHRKKNEKGVVGFGRLKDISSASPAKMWKSYGIYNGYSNYEEFKEAIIRVSKDKQLPKKISAFYLENVTFFQPVYLSECGMKVSEKLESYIYLKDSAVVNSLLDLAGSYNDLWSDLGDNKSSIEEEKRRYALFTVHDMIKDIASDEKLYKRSQRIMKKFAEVNKEYSFINGSLNELYRLDGDKLLIVFYNDKQTDYKSLIGQAVLYRYYLEKYDDLKLKLRFMTSDGNSRINELLNM